MRARMSAKLPQVSITFTTKSSFSRNEGMEFYKALLAVNGIGVVLEGDKAALVLLDAPCRILPWDDVL